MTHSIGNGGAIDNFSHGGMYTMLDDHGVAHYAAFDGENRTFTVSCDWTPTGAGTTVTGPEDLAGLTASVSGEDLTVSYDGAALSAGSLRDVAPANCLPWLLRAMEEGYLVEAGQETLEGLDCLRLALDTTAPGGKVLCTVWLGGDGAPLYAEFSQDSRVVLTARLLSFTSE